MEILRIPVDDELKMGLTVGTAVETFQKLIHLINEYDGKGIEEISISTLKQIIYEAHMSTLDENGLVGMMIADKIKEEE